jgi:hypothetical protein
MQNTELAPVLQRSTQTDRHLVFSGFFLFKAKPNQFIRQKEFVKSSWMSFNEVNSNNCRKLSPSNLLLLLSLLLLLLLLLWLWLLLLLKL